MDAVEEVLHQWKTVRPDLDVEPMGIVGRLSRVSGIFASEIADTFGRHGLSASSFDVLATLRRSGEPYTLSAGELTSRMMISSGSTTNRIQRLEAVGLVQRTADKSDARRTMVRLTKTGHDIIDRAVRDHVGTQATLVAGLDREDREHLERILRKLEAGRTEGASKGSCDRRSQSAFPPD